MNGEDETGVIYADRNVENSTEDLEIVRKN